VTAILLCSTGFGNDVKDFVSLSIRELKIMNIRRKKMNFSNDTKLVSFADQPCCNDGDRAAVLKLCVVLSEELSLKKKPVNSAVLGQEKNGTCRVVRKSSRN